MISRLDYLFMYPAISAKLSPPFHGPPFLTFSRMQLFQTLEPVLSNSKPFIVKSAARSPITDNIPRVVKADAESALFDYLHCTRGLSFLDAEHIGKNSPRFLERLITKVETEKHVSRALSRFFMYNPINEFEPFFESLGLKPREYASLLPRGLIFLSDDCLLLANYHTLCDYGVPRSEIGRIYKEVKEIFSYEVNVLGMKLMAYERLGLSRSTVIKLVICNPLLLAGETNDAFIRVFDKFKELGFDSNCIRGYLSSKSSYDWNKVLDTMCFLVEVGYSDAQIGSLFRKDSALLFAASGKELYVLIGSLFKLGLTMNEVFELVLTNPEILSPKCAKNYWKALHFLFEIGMERESIAKILSRHVKILSSHSLKGVKTVLRNFNGDKLSLCEAIEDDPSAFFNLAFNQKKCSAEFVAARNPNNIVEKSDFLIRIGYLENTEEMVKALKRFRGRGDQLQERFDCIVNAGLDFNTVSSMVKLAPTVLNQTKDILEKKMGCLRDYLGYPVNSIVGFPSYLCYDMERISVRFCMYSWLREKGAARPMISVGTLLACSDRRFVKYFVDKHPEGPAMWENLKRKPESEINIMR